MLRARRAPERRTGADPHAQRREAPLDVISKVASNTPAGAARQPTRRPAPMTLLGLRIVKRPLRTICRSGRLTMATLPILTRSRP
jgi:hypothetical protein